MTITPEARKRLRKLANSETISHRDWSEATDPETVLALLDALDANDANMQAVVDVLERWTGAAGDQGAPAERVAVLFETIQELEQEIKKGKDDLTSALTWSDEDQPLPEDSAIRAAHPTITGEHHTYQEAMRMVGAKRSKGALVSLVCWLLSKEKSNASR